MRELTQTTFGDRGNCWQTCIACILDIDPETMPSQAERDYRRDAEGNFVGVGYWNPLQAFLRDHHSLAYAQFDTWTMAGLKVKEPGIHMLCGPTVRTPTNGVKHVVVARDGEMIWDPHPSRAGLVEVTGYGVLVPFPDAWRESHGQRANLCVCPVCAAKAA